MVIPTQTTREYLYAKGRPLIAVHVRSPPLLEPFFSFFVDADSGDYLVLNRHLLQRMVSEPAQSLGWENY